MNLAPLLAQWERVNVTKMAHSTTSNLNCLNVLVVAPFYSYGVECTILLLCAAFGTMPWRKNLWRSCSTKAAFLICLVKIIVIVTEKCKSWREIAQAI